MLHAGRERWQVEFTQLEERATKQETGDHSNSGAVSDVEMERPWPLALELALVYCFDECNR